VHECDIFELFVCALAVNHWDFLKRILSFN
jgi:hypothetical protein